MRNYIKLTALLLVLANNHAFTASQTSWKCISHDNSNTSWSTTNHYKKVALSLAFEQCKKQSYQPASCRIQAEDCHYYSDGRDTTPMWQCTAVDEEAEGYTGTAYPNRIDAAFGSMAHCKQMSSSPDTCFINMITCININDRMMY